MRLKVLPKADLPREKLERYGPEKLQDHELLAIILGSGVKGMNVLQLSKKLSKLLVQKGSTLTLADLEGIKGLGKAKSLQILALRELSKRLGNNQKKEILSGKDIWNACSDIRDSRKEHLVAFYLDVHDRIIERRIISIGTLSESLVHPREVFEPALALHASSVLLAHNHPAGKLDASAADVAITKVLTEAGRLLGMPLRDHFILVPGGYGSIHTSKN